MLRRVIWQQRVWRVKVVERLAVLETSNSSQAGGALQNGGISPQDPCLCVVVGCGTLLRSEIVAKVESELHGIIDDSLVQAPGNVPRFVLLLLVT